MRARVAVVIGGEWEVASDGVEIFVQINILKVWSSNVFF